MSAEIRVEDGIVVVAFRGAVTKDDTVEARAESAKLVVDQSAPRFFVDLREATLEMSVADIFAVNSSHADALPAGTRHAVVITPEMKSVGPEDVRFAETVAYNRGTELRIFADADEARRWLREGGADT